MANVVVKKTAKRAGAGKPAGKGASVLYLYGLSQAKAERLAAVEGEGVDGEAMAEPIPCAGFVCWVSRVARSEFADGLAEHMEDLEWLATAGVRHQRVVASIAATTEILPARFGTVFISEASLEADVKSRRKSIASAFERVAAADEWGVKVFTERSPAARPAIQATTGAQYLKQKAAALESRPKRNVVDGQVLEFIDSLGKVAIASVEVGKVSGGQPKLQWQGSVLVRRAKRKQFENLLKRYASKWSNEKRIECSGPWPPYSFVSDHGR